MTLIHNHAILLKDKVRMDAYKKAIEETVSPGDVVVDVGCGLGILSLLAVRAGAKRVHAIEADPATLALARVNAKQNGADKKIIFYRGFSAGVKIGEKADVIVSELFGNLGLNENILPVMADARSRFLKDGGKLVPERVRVFFAPSEQSEWQSTAEFMRNVGGFNLLPDLPEADLGFPSVVVKQKDLLAAPDVFADIDFRTKKTARLSKLCKFKVVRSGILAGFAGWFGAGLTKSVSFSTSPSAATTHWKQGFLPLRRPEPVRAGQKIVLEIEMMPDKSSLNSIVGYHYKIST